MYDHVLETIKTAYVADHITAFTQLSFELDKLDDDCEVKDLQTLYYDIGKEHFEVLREWFMVCYVVFLGKFEGPRMWEVTKLLGKDRFVDEITYRIKLINSSNKF